MHWSQHAPGVAALCLPVSALTQFPQFDREVEQLQTGPVRPTPTLGCAAVVVVAAQPTLVLSSAVSGSSHAAKIGREAPTDAAMCMAHEVFG